MEGTGISVITNIGFSYICYIILIENKQKLFGSEGANNSSVFEM